MTIIQILLIEFVKRVRGIKDSNKCPVCNGVFFEFKWWSNGDLSHKTCLKCRNQYTYSVKDQETNEFAPVNKWDSEED